MTNTFKKVSTVLIAAVVFLAAFAVFSDAYAVTKPGQVKNVSVTCVDSSTCQIKWSKVKNASGYKVYRAVSKNGKYKLVKDTTRTKIKNGNLTSCKKYYYKVQAYKKSGTKKIAGKSSAVKNIRVVSIHGNPAKPKYYAKQKDYIYFDFGYYAGVNACEEEIDEDGGLTYTYKFDDPQNAVNAVDMFISYLKSNDWDEEEDEDEDGDSQGGDDFVKMYSYVYGEDEEYGMIIWVNAELGMVQISFFDGDDQGEDEDDPDEDDDDQGEDEQ